MQIEFPVEWAIFSLRFTTFLQRFACTIVTQNEFNFSIFIFHKESPVVKNYVVKPRLHGRFFPRDFLWLARVRASHYHILKFGCLLDV